jgi:hypothetical protein
MTIYRARQILGDEISDLTDKQVSDLLKSASDLCSVLLDLAINDIVKPNTAPKKPRYEQNSRYLRPSQ